MTRRPRIGYLIQQFVPEVGAGPARAAEMALRWRDRGADVTIITAMPNRPVGRIHPDYRGHLFIDEQWQGIRVLRSWLFATNGGGIGATLSNNTSFLATAMANLEARSLGFDVLIASSPPFFPHIAGVAHRFWNGTPLVLELRDLWPDYLVGLGVLRPGAITGGLFALERALLKRADHVVVVTDSFRRRVHEKGVDLERISVVPNGVDTEQYFPAEEPPPFEALAPDGTLRIGYLGNFGRGQGLTMVIDAAADLERNGFSARFVLAGDGPERGRLEEACRVAGVRNVSLHPPIAKDQTRAFYNGCDICLVPLADVPVFQETIPSKIFEVMACARPLIASVGGEAAAIVRRARAGMVTPPGNAPALASAIRSMASQSEAERAAMGQRARAYADEHYSRDALAARYFELMERVARRRQS